MTIIELIKKLVEISETLDPESNVFVGTYYQDFPIEDVEIYDGYPLIRHFDPYAPLFVAAEIADNALQCPICNGKTVDYTVNDMVHCDDCGYDFPDPRLEEENNEA